LRVPAFPRALSNSLSPPPPPRQTFFSAAMHCRDKHAFSLSCVRTIYIFSLQTSGGASVSPLPHRRSPSMRPERTFLPRLPNELLLQPPFYLTFPPFLRGTSFPMLSRSTWNPDILRADQRLSFLPNFPFLPGHSPFRPLLKLVFFCCS